MNSNAIAEQRQIVTPSPTFERIVAGAGLARRARQDRAVTLAHDAVENRQRSIIQAPTGVGKSYIALATAADAGSPGAPGIVATVTNSLSSQYMRDCRRAADLGGFTYTRVMGASHYVCADSPAAAAAGVPGYEQMESDGDGGDNSAELRAEREQWLNSLLDHDADPAVRYELRTNGLDYTFRCPGYPDCGGNMLGGCGSKKARARGFRVDVVVTNYHMLGFAAKLPPDLKLLPLNTAAVVVIDEAHELPSVISEIHGGRLTERSGTRVFADHPQLRAACTAMLTAALDGAHWPGNKKYDTEGAVPVPMEQAKAFGDALTALPAELRDNLRAEQADDEGALGGGDVLHLLGHLWSAAWGRDTGWRAWTTRKQEGDRWDYSREIELRKVDIAAQVVPRMLPAAAVFLSGTVGETLPAQLGLPDVEVVDLGQEFDWSRVRGHISPVSGVKTGNWQTEVLPRYRQRAAELAGLIQRGNHQGALILTNAHDDVATIARNLNLPGYRVFTQTRGTGSLGAGEVKDQYVRHIQAGGRGVLIGVASFATGLDLPGDLCTLVGWWVCHRGVVGYYDGEVDRHYPGHVTDRFRGRFAQGIGRLLRSHADHGEIVICDSRGQGHLWNATGRLDSHLRLIQWAA